MKILVDIGHPAHVHYFKNLAWSLEKSGHKVLFTVKNKEVAVQLLQAYKFKYKILGKNQKGLMFKLIGLFVYTIRLYFLCLKFQPEVLFNASPSAAFVSWLLRKKNVALEDTFNMEQVNLYMPFTTLVLTGDYEHTDLGAKQLSLPFFQELLYLHPRYFTPDRTILNDLNLQEKERYAIVRFVSWSASHDVGHKGLSLDRKKTLIEALSSKMRVFISSEINLPQDFEEYRITIRPERMHDALYYADLFIGESATMASESAILGTPAIYVNNSQLGYIKEEAKAGLIYSYTESSNDQDKAINKAIELSNISNYREINSIKLHQMLEHKIDVTALLIWMINDYPKSFIEVWQPSFDFSKFR